MPGKDNTGPKGQGPLTGRGQGGCKPSRNRKRNQCAGDNRDRNTGNGRCRRIRGND